MRFLMITTFYPPYSFGGDASYIQRLTHELATRGHEVDVAHCADAYRLFAPEPLSLPPAEAGVTVHRLHHRPGWLSPLLTQQSGRAVLKRAAIDELIRARHYDVIHYHNMSLIGLDVMALGDAVKLYTTHEHWLVCPTHVLWRYNREACTTQTCFTCQLAARRPPQFWRYGSTFDRYLRHVDLFLSPSRFTLRKHRELGFTRPMEHLPYFLPRPPSGGESTEPPHPRPYALFVGRLEKIKGVHGLLDTFRAYKGCDLLIVGDGTWGDVLREQAAGLDHVHFMGRLPYEKLRALYRHALALVVPSICFEVFGIVLLEAFAQGTPALVTPFGALPEVIDESGGGIVYRSPAELTGALERLRHEPGWRAEMGERGREAFVRLWSEAPHLARYLGIVEERRAART